MVDPLLIHSFAPTPNLSHRCLRVYYLLWKGNIRGGRHFDSTTRSKFCYLYMEPRIEATSIIQTSEKKKKKKMIILGVLQNLLSSARAPGVVVNISLNGALRTRTYTLRAPDFPKVSVSVLLLHCLVLLFDFATTTTSNSVLWCSCGLSMMHDSTGCHCVPTAS